MDVRTMGPEITAYLEAPRYGVIATHDPDGGIWQAVVWYVLTGAVVLMNARDGRHWLTNLRHDPRLSLVVADGEDYVILRGQATVIDDPVRGLADAMALARHYGDDPDTFAGQRRVSVVFQPEHVGLHGQLLLSQRST